MKKILFVTLYLLTIFIQLDAQDFKLKWGEPTVDPGKKLNPVTFVGKDDEFIYLQKTGAEVGTVIEKYSIPDMKRVYSRELTSISFIRKKLTPNFVKLILMKHRLWFITSESDGDNHILYATEIGASGQITDNKIKIMNIRFKSMWKRVNIGIDYVTNYFNVVVADDNNSFYAYSNTIDKNSFKICTVDYAMQINEVVIPTNLPVQYFIECFIPKSDNIYAILKTPYPKKERYENGTFAFHYSYAFIDLKRATSSITPFELSNHELIAESALDVDDKNNIFYYGFYNTNKEISYHYRGIFCSKMNSKTGSKIEELNYDCDESLMLNFREFPITKDKAALKSKIITNVKIQQIYHKLDGGIILVAERHGRNTYGNYIAYIADDIVVMNLNNHLELNNRIIIPKAQEGDAWGRGKFNSYFPVYKNGKLYLLYNESPNNLNLSDPEKLQERVVNNRFGRNTEMTIAVITVNDKGIWKKEELQKYQGDAAFLTPSFYLITGKNEAITYSEKDNQIKLATIKY